MMKSIMIRVHVVVFRVVLLLIALSAYINVSTDEYRKTPTSFGIVAAFLPVREIPVAIDRYPSQHSSRLSLRKFQSTEDTTTTTTTDDYDDFNGRRIFVQKNAFGLSLVWLSSLVGGVAKSTTSSQAAVIDATDIFADNDWSSNTIPKTTTDTKRNNIEYLPTDEIPIRLNKKILQEKYSNQLGLEIVDIEFRTNLRVRVQSIQSNSYAEQLHIQPNWIFVSMNDISLERTNAAGVRQYLSEAIRNNTNKKGSTDDIVIVFRDPSAFQSQLRDMSSSSSSSSATITGGKNDDEIPTATTQVAPMGDTTQRNSDGTVKTGQSITTSTSDQRVTVQQLVSPKATCTRRADIDDLLEISYTGTVVETGQLFDGSAILIDNQGIPGRGNDISIFFVLGKQPFGQFPPGWDVGLMNMCVGERRRLILPPALAYGSKGLPRRNIPPNATLQYDVTLISINGLATP